MPSFQTESDSRSRAVLRWLGETVARSFIPLLSLAVIGGTMLWGPWISLVVATGSWRLVKHLA